MFEELFTKPNTIERYRAAPLVEPRERYLRHLAESGARRLTLRQIALDQVRLLHVLDLREGGKVTVAQIEAIAPEWGPHAASQTRSQATDDAEIKEARVEQGHSVATLSGLAR